jgi:hypothetical protein
MEGVGDGDWVGTRVTTLSFLLGFVSLSALLFA